MGRGVEVRGDALVTAYADWETDYEYWKGWQIELAEDSGYEYDEYDFDEEAFYDDYFYHQIEWENRVEDFTTRCKELWPSLEDTDRWGSGPYWDETHVILENGLVEFGIANYSGMTALTIAPRGGRYADYPVPLGLAAQWARQIEDTFMQEWSMYAKLGTFSNGESVYTKEAVNA